MSAGGRNAVWQVSHFVPIMLYRWGIFLQNRATDILDPPEDVNSNCCPGTPHIMGHPDLRLIDLALPRFVPELLEQFRIPA